MQLGTHLEGTATKNAPPTQHMLTGTTGPVCPRLVAQHMRRAGMTVTSTGHEITASLTAPACLWRGDSLTSVITKATVHSIARHTTDLVWHNCAGIPQVEADSHLRIITSCEIRQIRR